MIPSVPNLGSQVLSGSSGREFGFLPELPGSLVVHPKLARRLRSSLRERAGGFGNRAGVPAGVAFQNRARFGRASAKFFALPLLLFLVLLFWLENKVKSTTT